MKRIIPLAEVSLMLRNTVAIAAVSDEDFAQLKAQLSTMRVTNTIMIE